MHANRFFIVFLALVFSLAVQAFPLSKRAGGVDIKVKSSSEFCSFLPKKPGMSIAEGEGDAKPFCTNATLAKGATQFPDGFIVSAHYFQTSNYAQVTGRIDRTKYKLKASDGGGQYDNKNEVGDTCNGYSHFVNLVEPDVNRFCIRCCKNASDCNLGRSQYGCERVVPGDYS